jgi:hypothetical protein
MKKNIKLITLFLILCNFNSYSQTTLSVGDIAFIGMNLDGIDDYAFILLKDVDAATTINFSDCGWTDGIGFVYNAGDASQWTWTSGSPLSCGTVINIVTNDPGFSANVGSVVGESPGLSFIGDQIFAFQGTPAFPTFIAAIHSNVNLTNDANWDGSCSSSSTSALPDVLTKELMPLDYMMEADLNQIIGNIIVQ